MPVCDDDDDDDDDDVTSSIGISPPPGWDGADDGKLDAE